MFAKKARSAALNSACCSACLAFSWCVPSGADNVAVVVSEGLGYPVGQLPAVLLLLVSLSTRLRMGTVCVCRGVGIFYVSAGGRFRAFFN